MAIIYGSVGNQCLICILVSDPLTPSTAYLIGGIHVPVLNNKASVTLQGEPQLNQHYMVYRKTL